MRQLYFHTIFRKGHTTRDFLTQLKSAVLDASYVTVTGTGFAHLIKAEDIGSASPVFSKPHTVMLIGLCGIEEN